MSSEIFCQRLGKAQVHPSDLVYMPKWIEEYARGLGKSASETLPVSEELLLVFLRGLRDRHVEAVASVPGNRVVPIACVENE